MAILDTFYILFKSDAKQAEQGFNSVNKSLNKMDYSLNRFARRWLSLYAIFNSLTRSIGYAFDLTTASQSLGVNIEMLDAYGGAVQKTGGTVEGFQKSLESLAEKLNTTPKIALQVLPKLADQFQRLGKVQSLRYGKILGLDMPTILLLQQGRRELDSLIARQKELGVVSKEDAIILRNFKNEIQDTGRGFRSLFLTLLIDAIPTITRILHAFQEFTIYLRKHSGLIKGALIPIAIVLGVIAGEMVIANIATWAWIAGIAALAAIFGIAYDDIQGFMNGQNSLIGLALEKWPKLGKVIKWVLNDIKLAFQNIEWVFQQLSNILDFLTDKLQKFDDWFSPIFDKVQENFLKDIPKTDLFFTKELINTASNSPLNKQVSGSILNNNRSNREINLTISEIQINTQATNPREIAYGLGVELQKQLRQTQNDIATGVLI